MRSRSNLTLDCVPGDGSAAVATARWTPPTMVTGIAFLHYEFYWFIDDESRFRVGQESDSTFRQIMSEHGDYVQGDTARFALTACYTDTLAEPDAAVNSSTVTANAFCPMPLAPLTLALECDPTTEMVTAAWTVDVPIGVELTGFEYTVTFTGRREGPVRYAGGGYEDDKIFRQRGGRDRRPRRDLHVHRRYHDPEHRRCHSLLWPAQFPNQPAAQLLTG